MPTKKTKAVKKVKPKHETPAPQKEIKGKLVASGKILPAKVRAELWAYDEYNQGSIVASGTDLTKIVAQARRYVSEMNVDNALAALEKSKSWEAYFPEVIEDGVPSSTVIYAGNKRNGSHYLYVEKDGKWTTELMPKTVKMKFYLGDVLSGRNKTDWYLADPRGKEVTSINDSLLERKTILFIKII
jgi:hypothetical protein